MVSCIISRYEMSKRKKINKGKNIFDKTYKNEFLAYRDELLTNRMNYKLMGWTQIQNIDFIWSIEKKTIVSLNHETGLVFNV